MNSNYEISDGLIAAIQAIRAIQTRDGIPPSLQDMADEMGVSIATVRHYLSMATRKGLITKTAGKYRSLRLTAMASTVPEPKKKRRVA